MVIERWISKNVDLQRLTNQIILFLNTQGLHIIKEEHEGRSGSLLIKGKVEKQIESL